VYYLYLMRSPSGRTGFGICQDYFDRNKKYISHIGDLVQFSYIYGGTRAHAKKVERNIKQNLEDNRWTIDNWKTEWLDNLAIDDLKKYVDDLIERQHIKLELVRIDYDITQEK